MFANSPNASNPLAALRTFVPVAAASFPSTGILDGFNRANNTDIGASWVKPYTTTSDTPQIINNQYGPLVTTSRPSDSAWATAFGVNQEAYATVGLVDSGNSDDFVQVFLCIQNPNTSSFTGYEVAIENNGTWGVYRLDPFGSYNLLGATVTQTLAAGDSFGGRRKSTGEIEVWYKPSGGSWTMLFSRTDSTYTSGGQIGIGLNRGWTLDDFGGGNTVESGNESAFLSALLSIPRFVIDSWR